MSPGAACGDPRAAPGYVEASRHARGCPGRPGFNGLEPTGTNLVTGLAPPDPQQPIDWWLWAISVAGVIFYVAGAVFYVSKWRIDDK